ncbi:hypothetical protein B0T16DRAFT_105006 [Cercophora newfieldiana]|uniref:F-box domain-containing protein n=1 Tax=Cercophora newfieldiana TaxID=92897 RepID=A0AA39YHJ8_9PEZI|nr:hypothetical protein B0T16DRAFT_105006 [Cercophora newfieldiana]
MATLSPLINLPEELCCRIAHHLGAKDAASLRLSCKRLHAAATESLFSFVRLYPNDRSVNRYNSILSAPHLNRLVKRVELNTVDPDAEWEVEGFGAEFEDDALDAFKKFPDFAGLTGVTLRFSPNVSSDQDITEWPEDIAFRRSILQGFFNTLAQPSASRITDVCFNNLQNINDTQFMQSEVAVGLLSRLKALRLYISTELGTEDGIPSLDIVLPELHSFMHQLPSTWLQPTVKNLTTLVLYQDVYFGFFPKLDLRGLHFPNLKTLSLGNYVFSHRWQLDWISSHLDTLENLYLQECPVLYFVKAPSTNSPLDPEGYPIRSAIDSLPATENEQHSNVHRMNDLTFWITSRIT